MLRVPYEAVVLLPDSIGLVWYIQRGRVIWLAPGLAVIRRPDGADISYCYEGKRSARQRGK
jgi:hypothetical protein